jgi:hypothetical protein
VNIDLSQVATAGDYPQVTRLSGKPAAKSALVTTTRTDSTTQQQIMGGENAVFVDTRRLAGRVVLGCVYAPTLRGLASGDVDRSVIEMTAHIAAEVGPASGRSNRKATSRRSLRSSIKRFGQAGTAFLRLMRQPNRPNAPRPDANRGKAAGSGVAVVVGRTSSKTWPQQRILAYWISSE